MNPQHIFPWINGTLTACILMFLLFLLWRYGQMKEASRIRRGAYVGFTITKLIRGQKNARPTQLKIERDIVTHVVNDLRMRLEHWEVTYDACEVVAQFDGKVWRFPIED